ncbi:hypothetical protein [Corynebacterium cystitidis]|uniref:hypothetical protein n=1 Tax=Corynebacterium cystitidis TaxID=35757 RepID=UPI00211F07D1|nr:hypothetical protein [Corynebacterium cystitidis]
MFRHRTSRFLATVGATVVAVGALVSPAHAQAVMPSVYTTADTTVGCSVHHADGKRHAYCTDLKGPMVPIPDSAGLSGAEAVGIGEGTSWRTWSTQGWGVQPNVMHAGSVRFESGLIFITDFKGGMHVLDGFRYAAYVGNGQAVVNPGIGQLSSAI